MKYQNKYRVETTRLHNWDYASDGVYYITICTKNRKQIFGCGPAFTSGDGSLHDVDSLHGVDPVNGVETGFKPVSTIKTIETNQTNTEICIACWFDLPNHYPNCILDAFVVMPDHVHGIIMLRNAAKNHPLSEIIRGFKTFSSKRINEQKHTPGNAVWQSRFYDRIIRNSFELERIREYIQNNPVHGDGSLHDDMV